MSSSIPDPIIEWGDLYEERATLGDCGRPFYTDEEGALSLPGRPLRAEGVPAAPPRRERRLDLEARRRPARALPAAAGARRRRGRRDGLRRRGREGRARARGAPASSRPATRWAPASGARVRASRCAAPTSSSSQDRDDAGREHAAAVADVARGRRRSVRLVEPAEGKDAADHLAAGHGVDEFVAARPFEDSMTKRDKRTHTVNSLSMAREHARARRRRRASPRFSTS